MKISIVTVCYNSASTIEDALMSVIHQDFNNVEHIVIDGNSTDNTVPILNSYRHISTLISEPDHGIYDAMNKGIALATGDVVGFLNADDFYADNTVLSQVAESFQDTKLDACFADLVYVDKKDSTKVVRYWKSCSFISGLFKRGWMPAHPTFFVRRRVYERLGLFDLRFPRQADFELTMRFLEVHKIRSVYIPEVWVRMRMGGASNNSIRGVIKGNLEAYRACKLHGLDVGPLFILRKVLSRLPQFFTKP